MAKYTHILKHRKIQETKKSLKKIKLSQSVNASPKNDTGKINLEGSPEISPTVKTSDLNVEIDRNETCWWQLPEKSY